MDLSLDNAFELSHKASPGTAFEISLATWSIALFYIGLIVDERPRNSMSRNEALACPVFFQPNAKVIRVADVKTRVCFGAK